MRWQSAVGKTADETWSACDAPPIDAAAKEQGAKALAKALLEWLAQILKDWKFFS